MSTTTTMDDRLTSFHDVEQDTGLATRSSVS